MILLIRQPHGKTIDREQGLLSGHNDTELSLDGFRQAGEMVEKYPAGSFDIILTSDMKRTEGMAKLAFGKKYPLVSTPHIRECDYGEYTGKPSKEVTKSDFIDKPYPGGESYEQLCYRVKNYLDVFSKDHDKKTILMISHAGVWSVIEYLCFQTPMKKSLSTPIKEWGREKYIYQ